VKHVFGMAKSHLDLKGAKGPKLELDFLRLVYVIKDFRSKGKQATGYMAVLTDQIAQRVNGWAHKYDAKG